MKGQYLVKIKFDDDGCKIKYAKWCAVSTNLDADRAICSGQVFGYGDGRAVFELKKTGKVTCKKCIEILTFLKGYKY